MGCPISKPEENRTIPYAISVKTSGAYYKGGTDADISIELLGSTGNATTGFLTLDNIFKDDFEHGKVDNFKIHANDVGLPSLIRLKLNKKYLKDAWHCEHITIQKHGEESIAKFPIYDWINEGVEQIASGEATLLHKLQNPYMISMRKTEVENNKSLFQWVPLPTKTEIGWGLPRYVNANSYDELPPIFKRNYIREKNFQEVGSSAVNNLVVTLLKEKLTHPIKDLQMFERLCSDKNLPPEKTLFSDWKTDESFGRQVLTGISPLMVWRCTEVPSHFNVTNDDVKAFIEGKNLEDKIKEGKIYISDYVDILSGLKRNEEMYCANSVALFHVNSEGTFLPIAIQLVPGDRDYLFTPADREDDWLLAKMYFRASSTSYHEWVAHLLLTHNIIEPFAVALFRCLPRAHPIYKLLRPHLRTVSAINTGARNDLLPRNSLVNKALSLSATDTAISSFKTFKFEDLNIPKKLKKLGTDDRELLPNYYYRDDAILLWNIMTKYVDSVIRRYYKSDQDVLDDPELQEWNKDVTQNGLAWCDNDKKEMPDTIASISDLVEYCVTLMFTSSVQHAAVNFGQYDTYKFIPNAPACMRLPPHKKGEANKKRILESLPSTFQAVVIIAVSYTLSAFSPNEVYLGDFSHEYFIETEVLEMQKTFQDDLKEASEKMKNRNASLEHKYEFLLPERIPNGVAI